ncbi:MAG: crossover junction endodeoxyribonuclease RuvC [Methylococcaceae bacterium TMED69]|nr:MAG: crossover junction endodeoxyribonuclease RuvC [Methylococcaceae bacterium TMED69]
MRNLLTKNNIVKRKYRILGIDPGSRIAGYAVIDSYKNKMDLIDFGTVKLQSDFDGEKLYQLSEFLIKIIESLRPDMIAVEKVFMGKNVLSALKLGQVRGVILLTAQKLGVLQFDYSPNEIKKAISGVGHASKEQVQFMAKQLFRLQETPAVDAADAIAVAVCHASNYAYKKMLSEAENEK